MKRKLLISLLAAEAVLCVVFCLLQNRFSGAFTALLAFPLEQIALGLRALSLSGTIGNAAAIALYAAVCLSPAVALVLIRRKRPLCREDALLAVLSAVLFPVLYLAINPGLLPVSLQSSLGFAAGTALLGGCLWSVLLAWAVLRILRLLSAADTDRLQRDLRVLLAALAVYFVYAAFGACFSSLLTGLTTLRETNQGAEHLLGSGPMALTEGFLLLNFAVSALPYFLDLAIVFAARRLLLEMTADRYSEATVSAAQRLAALCRKTLAAVVLSNMAFNLMQLVCAGTLLNIQGFLYLPLFSIGFAMAALLLARFLAENRKLKEDNDLFI